MWYNILKFEIQYRFQRADTYLYFIILFLYSIIAWDFIFNEGGSSGQLKSNASYSISATMAIVSAFFTIITSMVMGVAALRDFDHNMESLMFINPIKKRDYLLGRFLGSFLMLIFIFSGLLFGMMLGDLMPWRDSSILLPFSFWNYLRPFLLEVLPTLFFTGAIFFAGGALSRKLMVVYVQGIILLLAYVISIQFTQGFADRFWAGLFDPFAFQTNKVATQFWTSVELNSQSVPFDGVFIYNRILWLAIGFFALAISYFGFSFNVIRSKKIKVANQVETLDSTNAASIDIPIFKSSETLKNNFYRLLHQSFFYFKLILKQTPFWVIVLAGVVIILINSVSLRTTYDVDSYPTTFIIIEELQEMSIIFFLMLILFYSGELIWKERSHKFQGIHDALPFSDFSALASKLIGLVLSYAVLIFALILTGIFFQTIKGYYDYNLGLYFSLFFGNIYPSLILITFISFFFHVLCNHKFLSHFLILSFLFLSYLIFPQVLGIEHGLLKFDSGNFGTYSEMNGYGPFLKAYIPFKIYWFAFSVLVFVFAILFSIRGEESKIKTRWKLIRQRWTAPLIKLSLAALIVLTLSGSYIFYNINILNDYTSSKSERLFRVDYEKNLKHLEKNIQPKIIDVNLKVDLFPAEQNYIAEGYFILKNKSSQSITEVHIQKFPSHQVNYEYLRFDKVAQLNTKYVSFDYYIYELENTLLPGDSIKMSFKQTFTTTGFTEEQGTFIVKNGTFFSNFHFPTIGYFENIELDDEGYRAQYGLSPRVRNFDRNDPWALQDGKCDGDGEVINFEMIIGTDSSQIAVAPGYLQKNWTIGNRKYYHYAMDKPMSNFYSIVSAKYKVLRDQWISKKDSLRAPVDLEIFYHEGHEYNLDRMMLGMKKSLEYFSKNFGAYQYDQMRILEFPNYESKAQSFPNTVPFSEDIGFILDIDDEQDVDMAFFVTAHEIAHQWWGHQVNPANVKGMKMLSETLAQYSALMALEEVYPVEKSQQFLRIMRQQYLEGRTKEQGKETPLALVESGQDYIYYNKGLVNMYTLQDYISDDSVNIALKRFTKDWDTFKEGNKKDRFPTTIDLMEYFREVTPDSLAYILDDLFNQITLFDNQCTVVSSERSAANTYKIKLNLEVKKYQVDSLGQENPVTINDWIDIGVYSKNKKGKEQLIYLEKHKFSSGSESLEIIVNQKPSAVGIDPLYKLIDKKEKDNISTVY